MMKKIFLLIAVVTFSLTSNSQTLAELLQQKKEGHKISCTIKNLKPDQDTLILGFYKADYKNTYSKDTAFARKGTFVFKGKQELNEGMYFIFDPSSKTMILPSLFITNQHISFSFDLENMQNTLKFKNSNQNTIANNYQLYLQTKIKERNILQEKIDTLKNQQDDSIAKRINQINTDIQSFTNIIISKSESSFFSEFLIANQPNRIPDSLNLSDFEKSKYLQKHYWDNINFTKNSILYTPLFHSKIKNFFNNWVIKHPDSINVQADLLIAKARANSEIFQYVVSYITSTYERSKIMGMDAVFVHMVENYYITNQCNWVDSTQLVKISDRAQKIAPNLIGRKASEFLDFYGRPFMKDTSGVLHTLQEVNADYTVLVFFGPTCGHCKKEIPKIKHDIDSLTGAGYDIKTFSVATEFDKKEWKKFINTQKIGEWINVADINHDEEGNPVASSDWRDKYDIYSTPVIYLLDKDQKIIAKRITHTQIVEIISRLEEIN